MTTSGENLCYLHPKNGKICNIAVFTVVFINIMRVKNCIPEKICFFSEVNKNREAFKKYKI